MTAKKINKRLSNRGRQHCRPEKIFLGKNKIIDY